MFLVNVINLFGVFTIILSMILNPAALVYRKRFKSWNKNTNFNNFGNWVGYERNCSKNIYSFPSDMDLTVILVPPDTTLSTKQIILPRQGHLVFQKGSTVLFNSPLETCDGTELKYIRTSRGDWFDPNNWNGNDSLLSSEAIPHVERVPCQYDSVQFPTESSFHLLISSDVAVQKFYLGEEELSYTEVAILMSSPLGKIQFQKSSETQLKINQIAWEDNDNFICKNYESAKIKEKICSFVQCKSLDGKCGNPITPHGFCCPICGYHLKIQHNGDFPLAPVKDRVDSRIRSSVFASGELAVSIGRFAPKRAHIVFIPWTSKTGDVEKLVDEIRIFLQSGKRTFYTLENGRLLKSKGGSGGERMPSCLLTFTNYDRKPLLNSKWIGKDNRHINTSFTSFTSNKCTKNPIHYNNFAKMKNLFDKSPIPEKPDNKIYKIHRLCPLNEPCKKLTTHPEKRLPIKLQNRELKYVGLRTPFSAESAVIDTSVTRSWDDGSSNKLISDGNSGGTTTLIVLLVLFFICVTAFLVFFWTKRGYPPLTMNSIISRLPPMPGIGGSPRPSFSFARFSNERISNINIGATVSGNIQRAEEVDTEAKPIDSTMPSERDASGIGYTNATYDLCDLGDPMTSSQFQSSKLPEEENIYDLVEVSPDSSAILQTSQIKREE